MMLILLYIPFLRKSKKYFAIFTFFTDDFGFISCI